ncbi:MAG TPA: spermidine synthase [Mycobacteriales bacterium]|nr:spermidine synthase [Mycobacteriales bacterium]
MGARFAELDFRSTPRGDVSLRRRHDPVLGADVFEVLLGDEYLMSSAFTVAEEELARLALAEAPARPLDVVVGGLGLGCTAATALDDPRVASLHVVDAFDAVVEWHERRLLPASAALVDDARCRFVRGDFFAGLADATAWDLPEDGQVDAVLLDIDHSPRHLLHPDHAVLYDRDGLAALVQRLRPDGVLGLWSDDPPDAPFLADLRAVFAGATAHTVPFANPYTGGSSANTVYVARLGG